MVKGLIIIICLFCLNGCKEDYKVSETQIQNNMERQLEFMRIYYDKKSK